MIFHETVSHSRAKEYGVLRTGGSVIDVETSEVVDADVSAVEVVEEAITSFAAAHMLLQSPKLCHENHKEAKEITFKL